MDSDLLPASSITLIRSAQDARVNAVLLPDRLWILPWPKIQCIMRAALGPSPRSQFGIRVSIVPQPLCITNVSAESQVNELSTNPIPLVLENAIPFVLENSLPLGLEKPIPLVLKNAIPDTACTKNPTPFLQSPFLPRLPPGRVLTYITLGRVLIDPQLISAATIPPIQSTHAIPHLKSTHRNAPGERQIPPNRAPVMGSPNSTTMGGHILPNHAAVSIT
ncbi:hypothetical protein C8R44DRAFT_883566 [Mycena epipterygia]|nr:hypothetical protein C8R44DRAFT_883566 [Mycena epipterygia]